MTKWFVVIRVFNKLKHNKKGNFRKKNMTMKIEIGEI